MSRSCPLTLCSSLLRLSQELPVVPGAHVAGGGDEVDVEVEVLVLLEVRRLEPELARVYRRQLPRVTIRVRVKVKVKVKARVRKGWRPGRGHTTLRRV